MELQKLTNDVYERVSEYRDRPEVLNGMVSLLKGSRLFLENMRNLSLTSEVITSVEIETLEKAINETQVIAYFLISKAIFKLKHAIIISL